LLVLTFHDPPSGPICSNDGYISVDELTAILSRNAKGGSELARENARSLMKLYDQSNDMKLNVKEVSDQSSSTRGLPMLRTCGDAVRFLPCSCLAHFGSSMHDMTVASPFPPPFNHVRSLSPFCSTQSRCESHFVSLQHDEDFWFITHQS
jgi:hypothetical protein